MSRKSNKRPMTESQIVAQESRIPDIALKAFSNAYKTAIESGASILVAKNGQLFEVTKQAEKSVRYLESYGSLKSGTRLKIKKSLNKVVV